MAYNPNVAELRYYKLNLFLYILQILIENNVFRVRLHYQRFVCAIRSTFVVIRDTFTKFIDYFCDLVERISDNLPV